MNSSILRKLSYGMYAIGVRSEEKLSACIVNTVFQISSQPITIAVSVNNSCYTAQQIEKTGEFAVTILNTETPKSVFTALGFTSGFDKDKLADVPHTVVENLPVITEGKCGYLICKVTNKISVSTHTVYIAEVIDTSDTAEGESMTYDYYHKVIKGSAPPKAPTYVEEISSTDHKQYTCDICGYVYDGEIPFEELPDDWKCPVCTMPKSKFSLK